MQVDDTLVGFCGETNPEGGTHQCLEDCTITIGNGEEGFKKITEAFKNMTVGSYGRLIMINTLHPDLPNIPVLIMTTCNTFDNIMVEDQMRKLSLLFRQYVEPVLGPLTGPASDGDSRRRKMFLRLMLSKDGTDTIRARICINL